MGELAARSIALAEESGDPGLYITVAGACYAHFLLGEFREAIALLDRAIELADGDPTKAAGATIGCPLGYCLIFKGGFMSYLGELDEGRALVERGVNMCREFGDIETVGWGHMWFFWISYYAGETETGLTHAKEALDIADRIGDSFSRIWAWTFFGVAELSQERWEEAIEALERSLALSKEHRTSVEGTSLRLFWLAEAYLGLGKAGLAGELVREGLEISHAGGLVADEAWGHMIQARVLLAPAGEAAAEEIEEALTRSSELGRGIEFGALVPLVHAELAELARLRGDEDERERELREAHHLFAEIGATGHAERLAGELATLAG
jgi:tetratricopeptide (TPR) repeat protein